MKNGEFHISVENKGGKKYQGGQKEYCLTDLLPGNVITIELDSQGTVSDQSYIGGSHIQVSHLVIGLHT